MKFEFMDVKGYRWEGMEWILKKFKGYRWEGMEWVLKDVKEY